MEFDEIVVKESPGLCRCCLSEGCYKDMGTEYSWMNENEVYADMLLECFDISISQHNEGPNGPNRLICEVCITRLRDACYFKKQVQETEKKFIDMVARGEFRPKVLIYQTQMKTELEMPAEDAEVEYLEDEMDFGDDEPLRKSEAEPLASVSEVTADPLPIKGKRGRPKKAEKTEKKKVKLEPKAKTSKALVKEIEDSDTSEKETRKEMTQLLATILENCTVMPFRWCSKSYYMCFFCCNSFTTSAKLKQHMKSNHGDVKLTKMFDIIKSQRIKLDVSEISCKQCPQELQDLNDFLRHANETHDLKFDVDLCSNLVSFKLSDDVITCLDCGETFKYFGSLIIHENRYHNKSKSFSCDVCGQNFQTKGNLSNHMKNMHDQKRCKVCDEVFKTQYGLRKHIVTMHKKENLKCPKCPEILESEYLKKRHLAIVHNVNERHKCELCSKEFATKITLYEHRSRIHFLEKSATCEICGFRVFNKALLKKHLVSHNPARPFECDICKKTFRRKKTLLTHSKLHTGDRKFVCVECGQGFIQASGLRKHINVRHSTYEGKSTKRHRKSQEAIIKNAN